MIIATAVEDVFYTINHFFVHPRESKFFAPVEQAFYKISNLSAGTINKIKVLHR